MTAQGTWKTVVALHRSICVEFFSAVLAMSPCFAACTAWPQALRALSQGLSERMPRRERPAHAHDALLDGESDDGGASVTWQ